LPCISRPWSSLCSFFPSLYHSLLHTHGLRNSTTPLKAFSTKVEGRTDPVSPISFIHVENARVLLHQFPLNGSGLCVLVSIYIFIMHRIQRDTNTQAFHDMATHNVDDGTGGLDGSIVYELGRPEVCLGAGL